MTTCSAPGGFGMSRRAPGGGCFWRPEFSNHLSGITRVLFDKKVERLCAWNFVPSEGLAVIKWGRSVWLFGH